MRCRRTRPGTGFVASAVLAAALCGCGGGGGGGGSSAGQFRLVSLNVLDGAVWPLNRRIHFTFNKPVDPSTVSFNSIVLQGSNGVPVTGTFFVDPCSDGLGLVFQPTCPTDAALLTAGFQPNAITYTLTVLTGVGPTVLRATDGDPLMEGASVVFRTPLPPIEAPLADPDPANPPAPSVAAPDPGLPLPLNLFTDPLGSFEVSFDQSLDPDPTNVDAAHFVLEFEEPAGSGSYAPMPRTVALLQNCTIDLASPDCPRPEKGLVGVVPVGILPSGRTVRLRVAAGVRDIGQVQSLPADVVVASYTVEPAAPGGNEDAFTEEFDTSAREDPGADFEVPAADWGEGVLQANEPFPGVESTFDWILPFSTTVIIDTTFDIVLNPQGDQVAVVNGVLNLRNLLVPSGSKILGQGPNPLVINASGRITVNGEINVDGIDALNTGGLSTPDQPQSGAPGNCGGGEGGTASLSAVGSDVQGQDGFGPGNAPSGGGRGGHSAFGTTVPVESRRGGGGGGGVLTLQTHGGYPSPAGLNGGNGGPGTTGVGDCVDLALPVNGGARGPEVFVDGIATNNFSGRKLLAGGTILVGELPAPIAGQGGGGGGDAVFYNGLPAPPNCLNNTQWLTGPDRKAGAAGGGAGILVLRAVGPIVLGPVGRLSARGGKGGHGESTGGINPVGGGGGGGSGGMILVESANASVQDPGDPDDPIHFPPAPPGTPGGIRLEGTVPVLFVKGGDGGQGSGGSTAFGAVCRGGQGGGGVAQLHTTRVDASGIPVVRVGAQDVTSLATTTIDQSGNGHVLLPNFGPRSRSRSTWIDTGFPALGALGIVTFPWTPSEPNDTTNPAYPLTNLATIPPGLGLGVVKTDESGTVFLPPASPGTSRTIPSENVTAHSASIPGALVPNPATLARYALNPNAGQGAVFTIASAAFDGTNTVIQTEPADGGMTDVLPVGGTTTIEVRPRFFRVFSSGTPDFIPPGQTVRILFEGAEQISPAVVGLVGPTPDLGDLGVPPGLPQKRFLRFTVDFDLGSAGLSTATPRPEVRFLKVPIRF